LKAEQRASHAKVFAHALGEQTIERSSLGDRRWLRRVPGRGTQEENAAEDNEGQAARHGIAQAVDAEAWLQQVAERTDYQRPEPHTHQVKHEQENRRRLRAHVGRGQGLDGGIGRADPESRNDTAQQTEQHGHRYHQFANQEPGDAKTIQETCLVNYGVSFPMFAKVKVNGPDAHPVFAWLKSRLPGGGLFKSGRIKWNFTKFLVDREGNLVRRYASAKTPESIEADILELLGNSSK
jgi:hypothetical protein